MQTTGLQTIKRRAGPPYQKKAKSTPCDFGHLDKRSDCTSKEQTCHILPNSTEAALTEEQILYSADDGNVHWNVKSSAQNDKNQLP